MYAKYMRFYADEMKKSFFFLEKLISNLSY